MTHYCQPIFVPSTKIVKKKKPECNETHISKQHAVAVLLNELACKQISSTNSMIYLKKTVTIYCCEGVTYRNISWKSYTFIPLTFIHMQGDEKKFQSLVDPEFVTLWCAISRRTIHHMWAIRCIKWMQTLKRSICNMWPWTTKPVLSRLGCICSISQQYIVWVKIIDFSFMPKIIRTLSKDHVPWIYFVNFLL